MIDSVRYQEVKELRKRHHDSIDWMHIQGKEMHILTRCGKTRVLFYSPPGVREKTPVLLNVHGGSFIYGTPEGEDDFCQRLCQAAGVTVVNVDYRLSPEWPYPAGLEDVYDVALYIKRHADELGVLADSIGIQGDSAGANLSAATALMAKDRGEFSLRCQILIYPVTDLFTSPQEKYYVDGCISYEHQQLACDCYCPPERRKEPYCSPSYAGDAQLCGLPPALIITAEIDCLREEAEEFGLRLARAGNEVTMRRFPEMWHGFVTHPSPRAEDAFQLIVHTLRRHLFH